MEYLGEEATAFPLSLALEEEGFRLDGLEMGIAIGEEGLAGDFGAVVTNGEPTGLAGEPTVTSTVASWGHWVACLPRTNLTCPWSAWLPWPSSSIPWGLVEKDVSWPLLQ